jgi:gliding motility-associated-like protein
MCCPNSFPPKLTLQSDNAVICPGVSSVAISAQGAFSHFSWSSGDTTQSITVTQPGTYSCIATNGCISDTASITILQSPCCPLSSSQAISICSGNSYFFHGANLTQSGVYYDTLQNAQGCDSIVKLTLSVLPPPVGNLNVSVCVGNSYFFHGENLTQSGVYYDTLQNAQGCDSIAALHLTVYPIQRLSENVSIRENEVYTLPNGESINTAGVYVDTLQDVNGCDSIITIGLSVTPISPYVPNAFSPNGDGINDELQITVFGKTWVQHFVIFDRWGEKVFEANGIIPAWNGNFKGVPQPAGVYVYELTYFSGNESEGKQLSGTITLIR